VSAAQAPDASVIGAVPHSRRPAGRDPVSSRPSSPTTRRRRPGRRLKPGPTPRLDGTIVLLVEDDADARHLARVMLEWHGARVLEAATGHGALEQLHLHRPHVAVVDLRMPGLDGFGLVERLHGDERWARLPAIALTAFGSTADLLRTLEAGFAAHLTKPVDDVLLATTIQRVLRLK
jgi:CheY-like chemotaxis protein